MLAGPGALGVAPGRGFWSDPPPMRTMKDLVDPDSRGLEAIRAHLVTARVQAELLPCGPEAGERALLALQYETRSALGALAYQSGGLLVDRGWLRILGAGCPTLPRALDTWNRVGVSGGGRLPGALLIADDAVGGFFALNQGGLAGNPGDVSWLSPQSLDWEDLGVGFEGFLEWALSPALAAFYDVWRWPDWQDDVGLAGAERAFAFEPPPAFAGASFTDRKRTAAPVGELWAKYSEELPARLRGTS